MKKYILAFSASILLATFSYSQNKIPKNHSLANLTCKTCHSCEVPTKKNPCLIPCPRADMITINQSPEQAPEIEVLKELSNQYLPVVFSHKVHAQMSQMSGGCGTCHHYNTVGPIQPCINCHETSRQRQDISKPDLEAAYHRQCINCHREWSHSNNCTSCHALKSKGEVVDINKMVKKMAGKSHPQLAEPKKIVYETNNNKGKIVTFYHNEHTNLFGAKCIDCHKNENCTTCHDKNKTTAVQKTYGNLPIKIHKTKEEHHKPCFSCHQDDKCSLCHQDKPAGPFNHALITGWALNRFHENLSCKKCHGVSKKFAKLNNDCNNCHKDFIAGKFNHQVTGLKLSENHKDLDCTDCHKERNFAKAPTCDGCHDDESFPKDRPGIEVTVSLKQKK